jgi:hypothetical protein
MENNAKIKANIQAKVFRIAWDRKPWYIPKGIWLALGKKRFPGTYRIENLGVISTTK